MITVAQPNTLGILQPNDRFRFEDDTDTYYYIGNYGASGVVCWNHTKKKTKVIKVNEYESYQKIKVNKF